MEQSLQHSEPAIARPESGKIALKVINHYGDVRRFIGPARPPIGRAQSHFGHAQSLVLAHFKLT
jgi:hypothetical protein